MSSVVLLTCLLSAPALPAAWPAGTFHRGAVLSSWDGTYGHRAGWEAQLARFERLGVRWIELLTFAEQPDIHAPRIRPDAPDRWPAELVDAARARGFRIFLKPDVWSRQFYASGSKLWRGDIEMTSEADRAAWCGEYERFIVAEARQAGRHGVEMFSVGLEYVRVTRTEEACWRRLIAAVRAVYPGLLTYSADGNHEMEHVRFWDALDVIGVNAYFRLSDEAQPNAGALAAGWTPYLARMAALARRHGKPIVLTEAGYPSVVGAATAPWQWPTGGEVADPGLQARAYEALLGACAGQAWCAGVYWWKWYEVPERHVPHSHDYSPEDKPAEAILEAWYKTARASSALP